MSAVPGLKLLQIIFYEGFENYKYLAQIASYEGDLVTSHHNTLFSKFSVDLVTNIILDLEVACNLYLR